MAKVRLISWLVYVLFVIYNDSNGETQKDRPLQIYDLDLFQRYRSHVDMTYLRNGSCEQDHNALLDGNIFQDYSFWNNEITTTNSVANYLTSMWRYSNENNRSLVENEATAYSLAKTIALSSEKIFGSVVCFDKGKFQGRRRFCPYAFKNKTRKNRTLIVRDLGRVGDYVLDPSVDHKGRVKTMFAWWHTGKADLSNATELKQNTVYYDTNLDSPTASTNNSRNVSVNGTFYNVTSSYIPLEYGKWTTPYYDCAGGMLWMITYLAPFYDEADTFLGLVSFDIELDSIDIDECDAPNKTAQPQKDRVLLRFYGAHACRDTTECVHVRGGGFRAGNYRCVCRKGFYFPNPNAKNKYFNGLDVSRAKRTSNYSSYDCLPCPEGCDECVDDTPCMYQRNISLRTVFLTINEIFKALAVALGVFIFVYRETKIIKASSPVFMEIIAFGIVLMYFEITLGYFEDSVLLCIARSWLYHTGFILAFGSLLLKTWRIAVIFRLRTAKMIELTDRTLLKYLMLMLIAVFCYLMIWTWTQTHEYELKNTSSGHKYRRCVRAWFSNAIEIAEVLLLFWGVWLCLRVRNAPSAYNESKYFAWCIYNTVFIMILVGLLRIVLDNFHNPDVSYVVDFLSTHVVATIMLLLLFASKIYLLRKYEEDMKRKTRTNSTTSTTATDLRKSPFHLNRLVDGTLVCETEDERNGLGLEAENTQLREEIRNLSAKLAVFENKYARESRQHGSSPEDDFKILESHVGDSETESFRDSNTFSDKRRRKRSAAADSTTSNGSVFAREDKNTSVSLIENIKNAGKQDKFLVVPKRNSVSDEETLTVMSSVSNESN